MTELHVYHVDENFDFSELPALTDFFPGAKVEIVKETTIANSYAVIRVSDVAIPQFGTDTCIEWLCFEESEERWYLSEEKHERWEFDLRVDAENVINNNFDSDKFLTPIPIAERPLSPAAIESANWLVNQLAAQAA